MIFCLFHYHSFYHHHNSKKQNKYNTQTLPTNPPINKISLAPNTATCHTISQPNCPNCCRWVSGSGRSVVRRWSRRLGWNVCTFRWCRFSLFRSMALSYRLKSTSSWLTSGSCFGAYGRLWSLRRGIIGTFWSSRILGRLRPQCTRSEAWMGSLFTVTCPCPACSTRKIQSQCGISYPSCATKYCHCAYLLPAKSTSPTNTPPNFS